jgi:hypothetical protein
MRHLLSVEKLYRRGIDELNLQFVRRAGRPELKADRRGGAIEASAVI